MATRKKSSSSSKKKLSNFMDLLKESWKQYNSKAGKYISALVIVYVICILIFLLVFLIFGMPLGFLAIASPFLAAVLGITIFAPLFIFACLLIPQAPIVAIFSLIKDSNIWQDTKKHIMGFVGIQVIFSFLYFICGVLASLPAFFLLDWTIKNNVLSPFMFLIVSLVIILTVVLSIPLILFYVWFSLTFYIRFYEEKSIIDSMKESKRLVKDYFWTFIFRYIALKLLVCIYLVVLFVLSLVPILGILFNFLGILAYYCVVLPVVYIFVYKLYKEIKAIKSKNSKAKEDVKVWKKVILVLLYTGFISIIFILILGLGYFTVGSYNYMQDQGEFKEINIMEDFR